MQQLRYMDIFLFLNNYVKLLCSFVLLPASQKGRCPLVLFPRGVVRSFIRGGPDYRCSAAVAKRQGENVNASRKVCLCSLG